jgi:hypothetical protein
MLFTPLGTEVWIALNETLYLDAATENSLGTGQPILLFTWEIVLRDHATDNDPSVGPQCVKSRLEGFTADILEVDVDAVGSKPRKSILRTLFLVVESDEAKLVSNVIQLVIVTN